MESMSQKTRVYIYFPDTDKLDIYMKEIPRKGEFFNWNEQFYEIYLVMWTRVETEVWRPIPDTVHEHRVHLYCKRHEFKRDELDELSGRLEEVKNEESAFMKNIRKVSKE